MLSSIATRIGYSGASYFMFRTEVGIPSKYRPRFWHARHSGHVCPLNQLIYLGNRVSVGGLDKVKDTARGSVLFCSVLCCAVLFTQQAYPVLLRFFYHSNPLNTSSIAVDKSTMVVLPSNPIRFLFTIHPSQCIFSPHLIALIPFHHQFHSGSSHSRTGGEAQPPRVNY